MHVRNCSSDAAIIACRYMMGAWGVSLLNDGRNSLFYSQTIQHSTSSDVLGFWPCHDYEREFSRHQPNYDVGRWNGFLELIEWILHSRLHVDTDNHAHLRPWNILFFDVAELKTLLYNFTFQTRGLYRDVNHEYRLSHLRASFSCVWKPQLVVEMEIWME